MRNSTVKILNENIAARNIVASSARMSTQEGTALQIYARSGDEERDRKLIGKVLASGHKSVIEHQNISMAFNDVSVLVEQFVIEFRLASFTVKSRRYVDFSNAGFVIPEGLSRQGSAVFREAAEACFADYGRLLEMGIPKEDARFLLPYSLRSNFFMTMNARELIHMVTEMLKGRGARFAELRQLGTQLKEQFDALYPGVIDAELRGDLNEQCAELPVRFEKGECRVGGAKLIGQPDDAAALLRSAMEMSGRFDGDIRALVFDARPRELELLQYVFKMNDISLACLTHFTRHRIQSPVIPDVIRALRGGNFVLPESVAANKEAEKIYRAAFERQTEAANRFMEIENNAAAASYFAMSGHVLDFLMGINAREMLHFAKLRTCARAQWEIRGVARKMLTELNRALPEVFRDYGPSCAVTGKCPEGRMSCGHPVRIEDGVWIAQ